MRLQILAVYLWKELTFSTFKSVANFINTDWESQKKHVWSMIALESNDQLRQRMAWALSQILIVTPNQVRANLIGVIYLFSPQRMNEDLSQIYSISIQNKNNYQQRSLQHHHRSMKRVTLKST